MLQRAIKTVLAAALLIPSARADLLYSGQISADNWEVPDKPVRYIPTGEYAKTQPDFKLKADMSVTDNVDLGLKVRYNGADSNYAALTTQPTKRYVDQVSVAYHGDNFGVRAGILPYRTTWCRTYDFDSVFMREPDPYCSYTTLANSVWSGLGTQIYATTKVGNWALDGQVGVYKVSNLNKPTTYSGLYNIETNYSMDKDNKLGVSLNALNVKTATQFRAAILKSQQGLSSTVLGDPNTTSSYDTVFLGAEISPIDELNLRLTALEYKGGVDYHTGDTYSYTTRSVQFTTEWQVTPKDKLGFGIGRIFRHTTYDQDLTQFEHISLPNVTLAYRHDFDNFFVAAQVLRSKQTWQFYGLDVPPRQGNAIGLRLGMNF